MPLQKRVQSIAETEAQVDEFRAERLADLGAERVRDGADAFDALGKFGQDLTQTPFLVIADFPERGAEVVRSSDYICHSGG